MNLFLDKVKAGYPLLWVNTFEEFRVMTVFAKELQDHKDAYNIYTWDRCDGIVKKIMEDGVLKSNQTIGDGIVEPLDALNWATYNRDAKSDATSMPENSILFLKDFHHYAKKDNISRKIRNLIPIMKSKGQVLVILSHTVDIPPEIEKEITVINFKLPGHEELKIVLKGVCENTDTKYPKKDEEGILNAALGMTAFEAENAFSVSMVEAKKFDQAIIQREKAAIVKKTGLLEVMETGLDITDMGGMNDLKDWLLARSDCFSADARTYGLTPPRGLLLVGPPGTGKSLTAKCTAKILKRPLLRLDVTKIYQSYVGQSEDNLRKCFHICEAVAPCVLFIDEIEKAFAGASGGTGDSGVSKRIFGAFLTWLSDKTADVFIVATANSVEELPAPLLRGGRFDAIFWVDLPDDTQREEILSIHLRKVNRDPTLFDIKKLAEVSERFTGAEIEVWIRESMVYAWSKKEEFKTEHMIAKVKEISLIADLMTSQISESQEWAKARGVKKAYTKPVQPSIEATGKKRKIDLS